MDKINSNSILTDKVKSLENSIKNYKNTFQQLNEKYSTQDSHIVDLNVQNKKNFDLEEQLKKFQTELMYTN